jgi:hypothetical protein
LTTQPSRSVEACRLVTKTALFAAAFVAVGKKDAIAGKSLG